LAHTEHGGDRLEGRAAQAQFEELAIQSPALLIWANSNSFVGHAVGRLVADPSFAGRVIRSSWGRMLCRHGDLGELLWDKLPREFWPRR
jgi:hypothetical protein